jgi:gas vesicle protein
MKNLATFAGVTGAGLAGLSALPVLAGMRTGRALGSAAGNLSADVGTTELKDLARIEEIDSYRQAADEIMRRIHRAEKKRKRKQIPSARLMF